MGRKLFANRTGHDLTVQLQVRQGSEPGSMAGMTNFSLGPNAQQMVTYSGDDNPYLDGIAVNLVDDGEVVAEQQFVIARGSAVDDDFNTNDTIVFDLKGQSIVLSFANTWT